MRDEFIILSCEIEMIVRIFNLIINDIMKLIVLDTIAIFNQLRTS